MKYERILASLNKRIDQMESAIKAMERVGSPAITSTSPRADSLMYSSTDSEGMMKKVKDNCETLVKHGEDISRLNSNLAKAIVKLKAMIEEVKAGATESSWETKVEGMIFDLKQDVDNHTQRIREVEAKIGIGGPRFKREPKRWNTHGRDTDLSIAERSAKSVGGRIVGRP